MGCRIFGPSLARSSNLASGDIRVPKPTTLRYTMAQVHDGLDVTLPPLPTTTLDQTPRPRRTLNNIWPFLRSPD